MIDFEKIDKLFNDNIGEWLDEYKRKLVRRETQMDRCLQLYTNNPTKFQELLDKMYIKYNSAEWEHKWLKLGKEPPMPLAFFVFSFIESYSLSDDLPDDYTPSMFTTGAVVKCGYLFEILSGQGVIIHIKKL